MLLTHNIACLPWLYSIMASLSHVSTTPVPLSASQHKKEDLCYHENKERLTERQEIGTFLYREFLPSHKSSLGPCSENFEDFSFSKASVWLVFIKNQLFQLPHIVKTVNLAVWAISFNFLYDFTLFVIDMHQIMLISLFSTSFDHFHFHGFLKSKRMVILKRCLILIFEYFPYLPL